MPERPSEPADSPERSALSSQSKPLLLFLRGLAAVSLLGFLFVSYDFPKTVSLLGSINGTYVAAALAIIAAQFLLSTLRWHYVLHCHGQTLTFRRSFAIYGIGALANLVLITSLAGLSVRGLLLLREKLEIGRIVGVLFVERLAALGGMILCVVIGVAFSFDILLGHLLPDARFESGIWMAGFLAVGMAIVIFLLWQIEAVRNFILQLRESFLSVRVVVSLLVLSAVIILLGFVGVALLGIGLGLEINPLFFVTAMPVIAFVASLPVTIGGWGVREGMMVVGLGVFAIEPEPALALSVAYGFTGVFVTCVFGSIGLLWYSITWRTRKKPEPAANEG